MIYQAVFKVSVNLGTRAHLLAYKDDLRFWGWRDALNKAEIIVTQNLTFVQQSTTFCGAGVFVKVLSGERVCRLTPAVGN